MHERGERAGNERRRPEVEARQDDRPSSSGKAAVTASTATIPAPCRAEAAERDRSQDDERHPARGHQPLEAISVLLLVVAQERGQHEGGQAPGGYSGRKSRYGTAPFSILQ